MRGWVTVCRTQQSMATVLAREDTRSVPPQRDLGPQQAPEVCSERAACCIKDECLREIQAAQYEERSRRRHQVDVNDVESEVSRATSAYTVIPTTHLNLRMGQRAVGKKKLQAVLKYGTKKSEPDEDGRHRIEFQRIVHIIDSVSKVGITCWKTGDAEAEWKYYEQRREQRKRAQRAERHARQDAAARIAVGSIGMDHDLASQAICSKAEWQAMLARDDAARLRSLDLSSQRVSKAEALELATIMERHSEQMRQPRATFVDLEEDEGRLDGNSSGDGGSIVEAQI